MATKTIGQTLEALRKYKAPKNGRPYSKDGLLAFSKQLLKTAKECDSSVHEMAGLAIKRFADETPCHIRLERLCRELDMELDGVRLPATAAAILNGIRSVLGDIDSERDQ